MTAPTPPTALISWAHRDPSWNDEQAEDWTATVVAFAALLRQNGIDAELDLWQPSFEIDWTRWGQQMVANSDFVIIATSAAWKARWEGTNKPTEGAGAVAEADALKGRFGSDQGNFQSRTLIAMLPGSATADIPNDLHRLNRFSVSTINNRSMEGLLRALTGQPLHSKPPLGRAPVLSQYGEAEMDRRLSPTPEGAMRTGYLQDRLTTVTASIAEDHKANRPSKESEHTAAILRGVLRGMEAADSTHPSTSTRVPAPRAADELDHDLGLYELAEKVNRIVPVWLDFIEDHDLSVAQHEVTDSILGRKLARLERSGTGSAGAKFAILQRMAREDLLSAKRSLVHSRGYLDCVVQLDPLVTSAFLKLEKYPSEKNLFEPFFEVLHQAEQNLKRNDEKSRTPPRRIRSDYWWGKRTYQIKAAVEVQDTFATAFEVADQANVIIHRWRDEITASKWSD